MSRQVLYFVLLASLMSCSASLTSKPISRHKCGATIRYEETLARFANGNRTIDVREAAKVLQLPTNCFATNLTQAEEHSDTYGCECCLALDFDPIGDCKARVRAIHITYSGPSKDEVVGMLARLIAQWRPSDAVEERIAQPSSAPSIADWRIVYRAGSASHEVHEDIRPSVYGWTGTATLFDYR
jgi:hypothetical protein